MKKSFLATLLTLILALSCVFGLVACNDNSGNDENEGDDDGGAQTVAVTGVEVNENTWMLEVGKTKQLTATVLPENATDKSVTWSSADTGYVTVSNTGLVTAVAVTASPVAVTVTTANEKTATCLVTVIAAQSGGEEEGPKEKQPIVLGVGFNQITVDEEGYTCKLTVDITGNYSFTLNTDDENQFVVTIGTEEPVTYKNGDVITLLLEKDVEVEFKLASAAGNKDGNLSIDIVSKTKPLGRDGIIQVSSRVNSAAIEAGYIEVDVAVLEAGNYVITGGVTGGEVTGVYLNNYPGTCGASVDGEINIDLSDIAADDIDVNGAIKLKFVFNVTNTAENGFIFWAIVDVAEEDDDPVDYDLPELSLTGANTVSGAGYYTPVIYKVVIEEEGSYVLEGIDTRDFNIGASFDGEYVGDLVYFDNDGVDDNEIALEVGTYYVEIYENGTVSFSKK